MKKRFLTLCVASALLTSSGVCRAESFIQYNYDTKSINITSDSLVPGKFFTVFIGSGGEFSKENPPKVTKMFLAEKETGEYTIPLKDGFESGKYDVLISRMTGDEAEHKSVIVYDTASDVAKELAKKLNDAHTNSEFKEILSDSDNAAILGIDSEAEADYSKILDALCEIQSSEDKVSAADGYVFAYGYAKAMVMLAETEDVDSTIKELGSYFGCTYIDYESLYESVKKEFDYCLTNRDISDGFATFNELAGIAKIRSSENYGDVEDVFKQYSEDFGVDMSSDSNFNDIPKSKKYKVFYEIYNDRSKLLTAKDVQKAFDDAVYDILNESEKSSGSSGSLGGSSSSHKGNGGGFSGTTFPSTPAPLPETTIPNYESQKPQATLVLSDISAHYAKDAITSLYTKGIISGFPDNTFRPDDTVTRAQFSKIICTAFSLSGSGMSFDDVDQNHWAYEYVGAANANGIVNGDGTSFHPDKPLTRQDAAVMIYNVLKMQGKDFTDEESFADSELISDYAKEAVSKLAGSKILLGYEGSFAPLRTITRAEAAVITERILNN